MTGNTDRHFWHVELSGKFLRTFCRKFFCVLRQGGPFPIELCAHFLHVTHSFVLFMSDSDSYFEFGSSDEEQWQGSSDESLSSESASNDETMDLEDDEAGPSSAESSELLIPKLKRSFSTPHLQLSSLMLGTSTDGILVSRKVPGSKKGSGQTSASARSKRASSLLPETPTTSPISESLLDAGKTTLSPLPQHPGS